MKNEKGTIVLAGGVIGLIAAILVFFGNPANMGFCIACFLRDTTGALGLHSAAAVQYIRPEIIGLVLGACIISLVKKEFRPRETGRYIYRYCRSDCTSGEDAEIYELVVGREESYFYDVRKFRFYTFMEETKK